MLGQAENPLIGDGKNTGEENPNDVITKREILANQAPAFSKFITTMLPCFQ